MPHRLAGAFDAFFVGCGSFTAIHSMMPVDGARFARQVGAIAGERKKVCVEHEGVVACRGQYSPAYYRARLRYVMSASVTYFIMRRTV